MAHITLRDDRFEPTAEQAGVYYGWRKETESSKEDPETADWTRTPHDPNVQARLAHLREKNGLKVSPLPTRAPVCDEFSRPLTNAALDLPNKSRALTGCACL